jgi:hypothetical protein
MHGIAHLSYGVDVVDLFRRGASYVDRILRGAKPADLPVQAPTKYELVVNLKTAKAIGLTVPTTLLARADGSSNRQPLWCAARRSLMAHSFRSRHPTGAATIEG